MMWILNLRLACAALVLRMIGSEVAAVPHARPATPRSAPVATADDQIRDEMAVW